MKEVKDVEEEEEEEEDLPDPHGRVLASDKDVILLRRPSHLLDRRLYRVEVRTGGGGDREAAISARSGDQIEQ